MVHRLSVHLFCFLLTLLLSHHQLLSHLFHTHQLSFYRQPHGRNFGCPSLLVSLYAIHGTTNTRVSEPFNGHSSAFAPFSPSHLPVIYCTASLVTRPCDSVGSSKGIFNCDECKSSHGGCLYNRELDIHITRSFRRETTVQTELILIAP